MSENDKDSVPTKLLWVDLEMTGLDSQKDVILEVAAEVTDFSFKTLASFEAVIKHPESIISSSNPWAFEQHNKSGLFERIRNDGRPDTEVQAELIQFIGEHFNGESAILAGNSIHNDRLFIRRWWPDIEALLHYRMLDVSSWKIVMQGKFGEIFEKKEVHRAFDDIQASIAELQHYLDTLQRS
ncbi:MAG: oligoribonuclease [Patescibacteria group bacterium]